MLGTKTMQRLREFVRLLLVVDDGPTAVEYGVMLGLIVVACATAITTLGAAVEAIFSDLSTRF
jgi:pilus assembly protein Flp/PilA